MCSETVCWLPLPEFFFLSLFTGFDFDFAIEEYSDVCELTHDPCETSENNKIKMSNGKYEEYYSDSDVDIDTIDSEIEEEYRHKRLNIKRNLKK